MSSPKTGIFIFILHSLTFSLYITKDNLIPTDSSSALDKKTAYWLSWRARKMRKEEKVGTVFHDESSL